MRGTRVTRGTREKVYPEFVKDLWIGHLMILVLSKNDAISNNEGRFLEAVSDNLKTAYYQAKEYVDSHP